MCVFVQEELQKVRVLPESARGSLLAMLDRRTYWCISRQRSWGVPIPVFYHRETGEALITKYADINANAQMTLCIYIDFILNILVCGLCRHTVSHIAKLFKEKGSDCWWELPIETLLPAEVLKKVSVLLMLIFIALHEPPWYIRQY